MMAARVAQLPGVLAARKDQLVLQLPPHQLVLQLLLPRQLPQDP